LSSDIFLNVIGWRDINHSYSLVNQFQLLSFKNSPNIKITHTDYPYASSFWNKTNNHSGLLIDDIEWIKAIKHGENNSSFDWRYQIFSPFEYLPPQGHEISVVFLVTEVGIDQNDPNIKKLISAANQGELKIVTPSSWSKFCLVQSGFKNNSIWIVPHAACKNYFYQYSYKEIKLARESLSILDDDIVLLNISSPFWNKGFDVLIDSFIRALQKNKNLLLIIKDQKNLYNLDIYRAIQGCIGGSGIDIDLINVMSRIKIITDNLNLQQLRTLYNLSDWYVSPYRAEGFNLPVCESLACGTPVIVTEGGATDDFVCLESGYKIESKFIQSLDQDKKEIYYREIDKNNFIEILSSLSNDKKIKPDLDSNFNNWNNATNLLIDIFKL